jgi:uncharacterized protein YcgL (UPF0745 family)
VKQVSGLLAKAEMFLAQQRIDYLYQELYQKIRNASITKDEFCLQMAKAREQYLNSQKRAP